MSTAQRTTNLEPRLDFGEHNLYEGWRPANPLPDRFKLGVEKALSCQHTSIYIVCRTGDAMEGSNLAPVRSKGDGWHDWKVSPFLPLLTVLKNGRLTGTFYHNDRNSFISSFIEIDGRSRTGVAKNEWKLSS
jgi:hypothetical protein